MAGLSSISGAAHSLSLFAHLDDLAKNDPKIEQNGSTYPEDHFTLE